MLLLSTSVFVFVSISTSMSMAVSASSALRSFTSLDVDEDDAAAAGVGLIKYTLLLVLTCFTAHALSAEQRCTMPSLCPLLLPLTALVAFEDMDDDLNLSDCDESVMASRRSLGTSRSRTCWNGVLIEKAVGLWPEFCVDIVSGCRVGLLLG